MAQRYEKLAQRRVDERTEKLKSARKTRFDIRLNPFFSRPLESIAKEFVRQQTDQQKVHQTSPTHPIMLTQSNEPITPYTQFNNHIESIKSIKKPKKIRYMNDKDDHESGSPSTTTVMVENVKRSIIKSGISSRPQTTATTTTDAATIRSIEHLKLIFPSNYKTKYQHFFVTDQISHIYIQLVVTLGYKTMTGAQFRHFAR